MSKKILGLTVCFLIVSILFGITIATNNSSGKVFVKKNGGEYTLYYIDKSGKQKLKIEYPREPVIKRLENNVVEVTISIGNPNSYSLFIDMEKETVSPMSFESVIARNTKNKIVATAEVDSINIYNMFGSKKVVKKIKRDFSPVAALITAVQKAQFIGERKLYIIYQSGPDFEDKEEIINF